MPDPTATEQPINNPEGQESGSFSDLERMPSFEEFVSEQEQENSAAKAEAQEKLTATLDDAYEQQLEDISALRAERHEKLDDARELVAELSKELKELKKERKIEAGKVEERKQNKIDRLDACYDQAIANAREDRDKAQAEINAAALADFDKINEDLISEEETPQSPEDKEAAEAALRTKLTEALRPILESEGLSEDEIAERIEEEISEINTSKDEKIIKSAEERARQIALVEKNKAELMQKPAKSPFKNLLRKFWGGIQGLSRVGEEMETADEDEPSATEQRINEIKHDRAKGLAEADAVYTFEVENANNQYDIELAKIEEAAQSDVKLNRLDGKIAAFEEALAFAKGELRDARQGAGLKGLYEDLKQSEATYQETAKAAKAEYQESAAVADAKTNEAIDQRQEIIAGSIDSLKETATSAIESRAAAARAAADAFADYVVQNRPELARYRDQMVAEQYEHELNAPNVLDTYLQTLDHILTRESAELEALEGFRTKISAKPSLMSRFRNFWRKG